MDDRYHRHNRRNDRLNVPIVFVTNDRKHLLKGCIADDVKQKMFDRCRIKKWEIIAMETDKDPIYFLIRYDTIDRVCDIVKIIKQETTHYLWQKYNLFLFKPYWKKKIFWSDGSFACRIDEVSPTTIKRYIEIQG